MHQNTCLNTPEVKKKLFKDLILVVRKCIKTRVWTLQRLKNNFLRTWFWWSGNALKHVFNYSRRKKISFLRTWFWWSKNVSKHVFNSSRREKYLFLRPWFWWQRQEIYQNTSRRWKISFFKGLILVAWKCNITRF
jgi:hypothetical protein